MPSFSSLDCSSFEENYLIKRFVGQGSFAKVYKCIEISSGNVVAVKEIRPTNQLEEEQVHNEIEICRTLRHANIVSLYHAFEGDKDETRYLVMEFVNGESLFDQIIRQTVYSEDEAASIIKQLLHALDYLHQNRIVHRDIKPDNILLTHEYVNGGEKRLGARTTTIKLADFGLARRLPRDSDVISCDASGAPLFLAPETILEELLGQPVDMWACGVILFILLVGYPPFWNDNDEKLLLSILQGRFSFPSPYWDSVSSGAKDLVLRLIVLQPNQRITSSAALKHSWIADLAREGQKAEPNETKTRTTFPSAINAIRAMIKFRRLQVQSGVGRRLSESGVAD